MSDGFRRLRRMHSRIGKPDDVREVEDEGEDDDGNEAVRSMRVRNL